MALIEKKQISNALSAYVPSNACVDICEFLGWRAVNKRLSRSDEIPYFDEVFADMDDMSRFITSQLRLFGVSHWKINNLLANVVEGEDVPIARPLWSTFICFNPPADDDLDYDSDYDDLCP